jgi:hypothetical protein
MGRTQEGGGEAGAAGLAPSNLKLKIHRLCRHDDIKSLTCLTLQPKSKAEIGW